MRNLYGTHFKNVQETISGISEGGSGKDKKRVNAKERKKAGLRIGSRPEFPLA
jgi:hypothetical protein